MVPARFGGGCLGHGVDDMVLDETGTGGQDVLAHAHRWPSDYAGVFERQSRTGKRLSQVFDRMRIWGVHAADVVWSGR